MPVAVPAVAPSMAAPTPTTGVPPASHVPPRFQMPSRLPDDRTNEQIGGKVAEVLWGYYGQQGVPGTPLTTSDVVPVATSPAYDDAYADTLLAQSEVPPKPALLDQLVARPLQPPSMAPRYQVFERLPTPVPMVPMTEIAVPALPPLMTAPSALTPAPATAPAHVAAPVLPVQRPHVVQLGFVDGSTMDLAGDHPAAKALRAAAIALTLRDQSSR
jgi:hypothetical protein